jgi:hypothetical protein
MVKKIATAAVYIGDQQQAIEFWDKADRLQSANNRLQRATFCAASAEVDA